MYGGAYVCEGVCDTTLPSMADRLRVWVSQRDIQREWTSARYQRCPNGHEMRPCVPPPRPGGTSLHQFTPVNPFTERQWLRRLIRQWNRATSCQPLSREPTDVHRKVRSKLNWTWSWGPTSSGPLQLWCKHTDVKKEITTIAAKVWRLVIELLLHGGKLWQDRKLSIFQRTVS